MVPEKTFFDYIGHNFHTDLMRCPKCKEVYIPEKLVKGRMAEVERELEDK
ncbi:MAG: DNA-binding protein [Clostridium sp.]|nr:DNA-binding protein [Clostridium sp.]